VLWASGFDAAEGADGFWDDVGKRRFQLKDQADALRREMEAITKRLEELENEE